MSAMYHSVAYLDPDPPLTNPIALAVADMRQAYEDKLGERDDRIAELESELAIVTADSARYASDAAYWEEVAEDRQEEIESLEERASYEEVCGTARDLLKDAEIDFREWENWNWADRLRRGIATVREALGVLEGA